MRNYALACIADIGTENIYTTKAGRIVLVFKDCSEREIKV
jgi:hypothetical protein